jgi:putative transposase
MKGKRFTDEQIAYALRQAEGGTPVADVCRQLGVSEASFYLWKKKSAKLGLSEIRELRHLRDENARLKRLVADLTLDKHVLGEVVRFRPSPEMWQAARAPFLRLLEECDPRVVLVLGKGLASWLPPMPDNIVTISISHPSSKGFSYEPWASQIRDTVSVRGISTAGHAFPT